MKTSTEYDWLAVTGAGSKTKKNIDIDFTEENLMVFLPLILK